MFFIECFVNIRPDFSVSDAAPLNFSGFGEARSFRIETAKWAELKRTADVMVAVLLLPLVLPILMPILLLVALDGGRPIFCHRRVGRHGRPFVCYKVRTMSVDAEEQLAALLQQDSRALGEWENCFKLRDDPRITLLGRFLRRTSLDELPQILNVLKGEMSFIGPRPVVAGELTRYGQGAAAYFACRPGISGLWQVNGRSDTTYEERVAYDVRYAREWSPALDAAILLRTFPAVFRSRGSC